MDYTVYFADKAVVFTAKTPGEDWYAVTPAPDGGISRAKVTKILESYNKAAVVTPDPGAAFGAFAAEFALIEAAGGVVVNDCGQWLMIRRNGRWDLPKGHLECGERIEECAASSAARVLPALPKPMMTASYCFITFPVLSFPVACGLLRLIVPVMQISGFYAVGEMAALPDVLAIIPVRGLRGVIRPQGTRTAAVRCPCICGKFRFPVRRR